MPKHGSEALDLSYLREKPRRTPLALVPEEPEPFELVADRTADAEVEEERPSTPPPVPLAAQDAIDLDQLMRNSWTCEERPNEEFPFVPVVQAIPLSWMLPNATPKRRSWLPRTGLTLTVIALGATLGALL